LGKFGKGGANEYGNDTLRRRRGRETEKKIGLAI
jgi:hypothetical protein